MEQLSGPPIGMYCYDIAPFDSKTFVQVNSILINLLIKYFNQSIKQLINYFNF